LQACLKQGARLPFVLQTCWSYYFTSSTLFRCVGRPSVCLLRTFVCPMSDLSPIPEPTRTEWIQKRIGELQLEHRGLDSMIDAIGGQGQIEEMQLRRLKKRKLQIKDTILLLQMQLIPDIPA
jgi:hypothetical protein